MMAKLAVPCLAVSFVSLVACSSGSTHTSLPTSTTWRVLFPSAAVAVATDTVQLLVFDASPGVADTDCGTLIVKRKSKAELPPRLVVDGKAAETRPSSPCDLQATAAKGLVPVSYGARSFLAIAQRGGNDFFIGCASATISEGTDPQTGVEITLSQAGTTTVPLTMCTLSQKCSGMSC